MLPRLPVGEPSARERAWHIALSVADCDPDSKMFTVDVPKWREPADLIRERIASGSTRSACGLRIGGCAAVIVCRHSGSPNIHGAAEPLWRQLADILRSKIESGELLAGRVMPSENTLSQEHELARGTVVKALAALERDGLVVRVRGRGTFVSER